MGMTEIFFIGIGLAMDAFAVSICKGLSMKKLNLKKIFTVGIYFGLFQAIMPLIGYLLGSFFENIVIKIDHWIAFILLVVIGINMIKEVFNKDKDENEYNDSIDPKTMIILAIATSIDALAVGITFAFLKTNILLCISIIGIVTFVISALGVKIGNKFGDKFEKNAQLVGGGILILIGVKILLEHLMQ